MKFESTQIALLSLGVCALACSTTATNGDGDSLDVYKLDTYLHDIASDTSADTTSHDGQTDAADGGDAADDAAPAPAAQCHSWASPKETGKVQALSELSGLARSAGGGLWAHNDSGETEARVFLLDTTGALRAVLHIPGVQPVDWEDMAVGACAGGQPSAARCLWIGDIGDNGHKRSGISVLRVSEPAALGAGLPNAATVTDWTASASDVAITAIRYPPDPSGAAALSRPDAEALAVLSDGRLLIATKRDDGMSRLFRVTPNPAATSAVVAVWIGTLDVRDPPLVKGLSLQVTGADLVGDQRLLVRSYFRAWAIDVPIPLTAPTAALQSMFGDATKGPKRTKLTSGFDIQGESIASDGAGGFWHTSELKSQPLWHVACSP